MTDTAKPILDTHCTKCEASLMREVIFAAMAQFGGAQLSWNPAECPEGGDHDFPLRLRKTSSESQEVRM